MGDFVIGVIVGVIIMVFAVPCEAVTFYGPYDVEVVEVKDGDTNKMEVQVWLGLHANIAIRVAGIDTAEKGWRARSDCEREDSRIATGLTVSFLINKQITISNVRWGKYAGRAIADVSADGQDLGTALLASGYAVPYKGGKKQPWECIDNE